MEIIFFECDLVFVHQCSEPLGGICREQFKVDVEHFAARGGEMAEPQVLLCNADGKIREDPGLERLAPRRSDETFSPR